MFKKLKIMNSMLLVVLLMLLSMPIRAEAVCTLIYDADNKIFMHQEGACNQPISPASTFKIPLSLIGYDSGFLTSLDSPAFPYQDDYIASMPSHQQTSSPRYWMKNSVVWYSQLLTQSLGIKRLYQYLDIFDYGNKDLSGDGLENNGLTRAWLSSSLKITPLQQLGFLKKLVNRELSVAEQAYWLTSQLLKQDEVINNYAIYGKTGTVVSPQDKNGQKRDDIQYGWFVGWLQKQDKPFIFVNVISQPKQSGVFAGPSAKADMLSRLTDLFADD